MRRVSTAPCSSDGGERARYSATPSKAKRDTWAKRGDERIERGRASRIEANSLFDLLGMRPATRPGYLVWVRSDTAVGRGDSARLTALTKER